MTNRFAFAPWVVMVAVIWACVVKAEPVAPAQFQALAQSRDAVLGALVYSDASIAVRSKGVNLNQKTCSTETVVVEEPNEGDKARYLAEKAQHQEAVARRSQQLASEASALLAQFQEEMKALPPMPPDERAEKGREGYLRYQARMEESARRYPEPQLKPLRVDKREFKLLKLAVLVKGLPPQDPIIQTAPPFTDGLSLEKHFATVWKAAPGALDVYVHKVLPAIVKICPEASAVKLSLGFHEVAQVSVQPPGHFEVAKIVMAIQPNGTWAPQHIQGHGAFDLSVLGVSRRRVTSSASHGQMAWLDQQEWNAVQFDDLKLQAGALAVDGRDNSCALDGCPSECGPDDEDCPGGRQAAMERYYLRSCSKEGQWTSKNCKIIESFFGRLDQSVAIDVPAEFESLYGTLNAGRSFSANRVNVAFTSGLGVYLVDKCRILNSDEATVIRNFSQSGFIANLWPGQRGVSQQASAMAEAVAAAKAGKALGEQIACRSPESYMLAKKMVRSIQANAKSR